LANVEWTEVQQRLLDVYGLRVEPAMGRYVMRHLTSGEASKLPVIGGNAKTGTPMRTLIDPAVFQQNAPAPTLPTSLFPQ
jgi:hypothetical protein